MRQGIQPPIFLPPRPILPPDQDKQDSIINELVNIKNLLEYKLDFSDTNIRRSYFTLDSLYRVDQNINVSFTSMRFDITRAQLSIDRVIQTYSEPQKVLDAKVGAFRIPAGNYFTEQITITPPPFSYPFNRIRMKVAEFTNTGYIFNQSDTYHFEFTVTYGGENPYDPTDADYPNGLKPFLYLTPVPGFDRIIFTIPYDIIDRMTISFYTPLQVLTFPPDYASYYFTRSGSGGPTTFTLVNPSIPNIITAGSETVVTISGVNVAQDPNVTLSSSVIASLNNALNSTFAATLPQYTITYPPTIFTIPVDTSSLPSDGFEYSAIVYADDSRIYVPIIMKCRDSVNYEKFNNV